MAWAMVAKHCARERRAALMPGMDPVGRKAKAEEMLRKCGKRVVLMAKSDWRLTNSRRAVPT